MSEPPTTDDPAGSKGLPTMAGYALADVTGERAGGVDWRVDPDRAVLLVHDMQEYFAGGFDPAGSPYSELVSGIRSLRDAADAAGIPVVYTAQPGDQDPAERALLTDFWGAGLADRADHVSIVADLAPRPHDHQLTKWRYSAFQRTPLAEMMQDWARDQLVVTGVYAHIGCLATCLEGFMLDVYTFLVGDAVADFDADHHRMALDYAASRCAAVVSVDDVTAAFTAGGAPGGPGAATAGAVRFDPDRLRATVLELLGEPVEDDEDLQDAGLDSVHVLEIVEQLQEAGHDIAVADVTERPTLQQWFELLDR